MEENNFAYWKTKFFETMCSQCFYIVDKYDAKKLIICPGCGRRMIDNYDTQSGGCRPDSSNYVGLSHGESET